MSRLLDRWNRTDSRLDIIQSMAYDGFAGTHVGEILKVEDRRTYLEITYTVIGRKEPQTLHIVWRRPLASRKATWLKVLP